MSGIFILLVGPSGSGKDTLLKYALSQFPDLVYPPSYTTRKIRTGESQGNPYNFISREEFEQMAGNDEFLEWAEYAGNLYGTAKKGIYDPIKNGDVVIKQVEVQGARQLLGVMPKENLYTIFISAGPWKELEERIRGRGSITEEAIQKRKARFEDEMTFMEKADAVVENRNGKLEEAKQQLKEVISEVKETRV
ncbi:MAG: guanylate kinase [Candidatus Paceibacterota bacterium]